MGLGADIESKFREAVAANEAEDYALAAKKLRSAIFLMGAHPRLKFEESETEYVRDDLIYQLKEVEKKASEQAQRQSLTGGFSSIPIRTRID